MLDIAGRKRDEKLQLLNMIHQVREDHPSMGCRDLYYKLAPEFIGRDAFEEFCRENGMMSRISRNYRRTTDSSGVKRFDNLVEQTLVSGINQVWTSDITYYEVGDRFCYITFIQDAYSRRILGHSVSQSLHTEHTTLPALQMAIKNRKNTDLTGLIFHSDGGGQYYARDFLRVTVGKGIRNSMCIYPWENGKAERLNGVIKNNYLRHRNIRSFKELKDQVDQVVLLYNIGKPHIRLSRNSPVAFEEKILLLQQQTKDSKCIICK
jgi:putative transposase